MSPIAAADPATPKTVSWTSRINLVLQTIARYLLAFGIMPYGVSKLANLQFQVTSLNYSNPLGATNGKILTWAFLGYAPWFQFLLGFLESFPGILLCFRRTRRVGALLLFPVLMNVALMNFAMDLWDGTKRISLILLALNLYLLGCDFPMYIAFGKRMFQAEPMRRIWLRRVVAFGEVLVASAVVGYWAHNLHTAFATTLTPMQDFIGKRQINSAGTWSVQKIVLGGKEFDASGRFVLFDFQGFCYYKADGVVSPRGRFNADQGRRTIEISGLTIEGDGRTIHGTYLVKGSQIELHGERGGQPVEILLERSNWGRQLPY